MGYFICCSGAKVHSFMAVAIKKKSMTGKALIEKPTVERSLGQETGSSDFPPYPTPSCQGTALSDLRSKARDP